MKELVEDGLRNLDVQILALIPLIEGKKFSISGRISNKVLLKLYNCSSQSSTT